MPASAPASSETVRSWRGRPPRKARLQAVCHCQVRKSEGCCARSSSAFQRGSSRASKPARGSTFIGTSGIRVTRLAAEIPQVPAILPGGLVHGSLEIVAEVLPHLLSHALDEARNAGRVVLVEVSELGGVGGGFESGVFRLGGGEPGHEAGELSAAAARTSRVAGRREGPHEQTDASMAALAVVLVDGHARSSGFPALRCHILARGCKGGGRAASAGGSMMGSLQEQGFSPLVYKYWWGSDTQLGETCRIWPDWKVFRG